MGLLDTWTALDLYTSRQPFIKKLGMASDIIGKTIELWNPKDFRYRVVIDLEAMDDLDGDIVDCRKFLGIKPPPDEYRVEVRLIKNGETIESWNEEVVEWASEESVGGTHTLTWTRKGA